MANDEHRQGRDQLADVRTSATETGRVNQKLRTRQALIEATRELLDGGARPTLADVAERALVSKTTAYRYFASADALIAEVFFDREFPTVEGVLGDAGDDATARVLAVEAAVNDALLTHEAAMRMIVRNAIDVTLGDGEHATHRIGRRLTLIDAALEPLERELDPAAIARLRNALALVIGPEAILAARDVCGLSPTETRAVARWASEALLAHALDSTDEQRTARG